jgi:hypothetical protein
LAENGIVPLSTGELKRHYPDLFGTKDKGRTAIKAVKDKYPEIAQIIKVGGISSINTISRQYPTYFYKTTALIRYTPDLKGGQPVYALIQKRDKKSLQDTLDGLTATKLIPENNKIKISSINKKVHYEIISLILKELVPLPDKPLEIQFYDEKEQTWVPELNNNTTDQCGVVNGGCYYFSKHN